MYIFNFVIEFVKSGVGSGGVSVFYYILQMGEICEGVKREWG